MTATIPWMGDTKPDSPNTGQDERRPFQAAALNVALAWVAGSVVACVLVVTRPSVAVDLSWAGALLITLGSLVVALGSGLPGIWLDSQRPTRTRALSQRRDLGLEEQSSAGADQTESAIPLSKAEAAKARRQKLVDDIKSLGIGLEFAGSMALRLVGTVALFMLCRYHLAASDRLIALWVLSWYGWLTFVEVVSLCREVSPARSLGRESHR